MRQDRIIQASIFDLFSEHEIGRELKAMSAWLDAHREVIALVAAELCRPGLKPTGRDGLPAESVSGVEGTWVCGARRSRGQGPAAARRPASMRNGAALGQAEATVPVFKPGKTLRDTVGGRRT